MFSIEYYTHNNKCPILDFLKSIPKKDAAKILKEIELLEEFGLALGMPHIKKMAGSKNLWELRIKQSTNNYRIFYFTMHNHTIVLLNAFLKKSQKTPYKEIQRALTYMHEYIERNDLNETQ